MVSMRDKRALGMLSARPITRVKELMLNIRLKDEKHVYKQDY
jgi:hypothetical protein